MFGALVLTVYPRLSIHSIEFSDHESDMRRQSKRYGVWNNPVYRCPAIAEVLRKVLCIPSEQSWHSDVGRADQRDY
ncbi:hypothetical protein VN97_g5123 [Penicillium thymicola]|uniref:Uncharacterized protein n=1 Tax=Penicillium thymicola TaxID=293382 RepID=A0AAI9TIX8_PENTH|nr:hypothetical protein VN97_g5123 [Penicillium thymicola]